MYLVVWKVRLKTSSKIGVIHSQIAGQLTLITRAEIEFCLGLSDAVPINIARIFEILNCSFLKFSPKMISLKPTHLIICCCHSIYHPQTSQNSSNSNTMRSAPGTNPSDWLLAPFQKDEQTTFLEHARTSIELLASTPDSLLVFSGGFTDPNIRLSEAGSYLRLCEGNDFWGKRNEGEGEGLRERIILEENALDSLQNLLFSILEFWKKEGRWPERITIISMGFKEKRFMELQSAPSFFHLLTSHRPLETTSQTTQKIKN